MRPAGKGARSVARTLLAVAVAIGLGVGAAGCGSSSSAQDQPATAATPPPAGPTVHVDMKVLEFTPAAVGAKIGQTVVWANEDSSPHNVTYVSGPRFRSSGRLAPGARFSLKLTSSGTIHYVCTLHPWMKATIVVSR
jgi:plastocyanin